HDRLRTLLREIVYRSATAAAHLQDITKAHGGDETDPRAALLHQGVDAHGGAVEQSYDLGHGDIEAAQAYEHLLGLTPGDRIFLLASDFAGAFVDQHEIDERAAGVDGDAILVHGWLPLACQDRSQGYKVRSRRLEEWAGG